MKKNLIFILAFLFNLSIIAQPVSKEFDALEINKKTKDWDAFHLGGKVKSIKVTENETDRNGENIAQFLYTFDTEGMLIHKYEKNYHMESDIKYTYDSYGKLTSIAKNVSGNKVEYLLNYNRNGTLSHVKREPYNDIYRYSYNDFGKITIGYWNEKVLYNYSYSDSQQLNMVVSENKDEYIYYNFSQVPILKAQKRGSNFVEEEYNEKGLLIRSKMLPNGSETVLRYNKFDDLIERKNYIIDERGREDTLSYSTFNYKYDDYGNWVLCHEKTKYTAYNDNYEDSQLETFQRKAFTTRTIEYYDDVKPFSVDLSISTNKQTVKSSNIVMNNTFPVFMASTKEDMAFVVNVNKMIEDETQKIFKAAREEAHGSPDIMTNCIINFEILNNPVKGDSILSLMLLSYVMELGAKTGDTDVTVLNFDIKNKKVLGNKHHDWGISTVDDNQMKIINTNIYQSLFKKGQYFRSPMDTYPYLKNMEEYRNLKFGVSGGNIICPVYSYMGHTALYGFYAIPVKKR